MSTTEEEVVVSVDDRRLERSQEVREQIVNVLAGEPMDILANAKDKDLAKILLTTLKDMDDQILKRQKLKVDEKTNETNAAMVAQIARQMAEDSIKRNGTTDYMASNSQEQGRIPTPDLNRFSGIEAKPGEMEQEENNSDVDSFMATHGKAARKAHEIDSDISKSL